jgi:hypothetical protein
MYVILSVIQLTLVVLNLNLHPPFRPYGTLGVIILAPCIGFMAMQSVPYVSIQMVIWGFQIAIVALASYLWGANRTPRRRG